MLTLRGVHAKYGEVEVLKGIDLAIRDGQYVAVIGANGHGKTTLLKTISGLVRASAGSVVFHDEDITALPPHEIGERGIVHVPEGARLFPQMTVEENLLVGAYGKSAWAGRPARLKSVYELFPVLQERRRQLAQSLSGGERQMVALGRGMMADKVRLLMIDEPSAGLAPILIDEVYRKIAEIRKTGVSLMLVEQSPRRIADAEYVYLMENGEIRMHGSAKEVLESSFIKQAYLGISG